MAHTNNPNGTSGPITVDQIVAALQQLGITLSNASGDGSVPFSIVPTTASTATTGHFAPAPTPTAAVLTPAVAPAPAAGFSFVEGTAGSTAISSAQPGGWSGLSSVWGHRSAAAAALPANTAASGPPVTTAPPSSPVSADTAVIPAAAGADTALATPPTAAGVVCPHVCMLCQPALPVAGPSALALLSNTDAWYAVTMGRAVGVFQGWAVVEQLVHRVPGFSTKKYPSREAALAAFEEAKALGLVKVKG